MGELAGPSLPDLELILREIRALEGTRTEENSCSMSRTVSLAFPSTKSRLVSPLRGLAAGL